MTELVVIIGEDIPELLLKSWDIDLKSYIEFDFPETKKHPKEHIEWVKTNIERILDHPGPVVIKTYSDFIIREINIFIMEGKIDYEKVRIVDNEEGTIHYSNPFGIKASSLDRIIDEQNNTFENSYYNLWKKQRKE